MGILDWFGKTDSLGTGVTYQPDATQYDNYSSLSMGEAPYDPEIARRKLIEWQMAQQALGTSGQVPEGMTGLGVRFSARPEEGLYQPGADIKAQTISRLAQGGSNIPEQLGSNDPKDGKPSLNWDMLRTGVDMMKRGNPQQPRAELPKVTPWGAEGKPGSSVGKGVFQKLSPYADVVTAFQSAKFRDALKKRMSDMKVVDQPTGLLG